MNENPNEQVTYEDGMMMLPVPPELYEWLSVRAVALGMSGPDALAEAIIRQAFE